jgi:hypothetical protein
MAEREGARKEGQFKVICILPDMCKTPGSSNPVPYQISSDLKDSVRYSPDVNFMGHPAMTLDSRAAIVQGNEAGTDGGVKSGVNQGHCVPINGSPTVNVNASAVLFQDATYMWMNTNGPDGQGNTIGKMIYMGKTVQVREEPDPPPGGSAPHAFVQTEAERRYLEQLSPASFLKNIASADSIVSLALMAPSAVTADWSDPGAILGAFSGLAGAGGIAAVSQVAAIAAQGCSLANTDCSNPGSILGAAFTAAGLGQMAGAALGGGNGTI